MGLLGLTKPAFLQLSFLHPYGQALIPGENVTLLANLVVSLPSPWLPTALAFSAVQHHRATTGPVRYPFSYSLIIFWEQKCEM